MSLRIAVACLAVGLLASCGDSPTAPSRVNLTGTWMGTMVFKDFQLEGTTAAVPYTHFWLVQEGRTVTGAWGGIDEWYTKPPISGTVDGNKFTFVLQVNLREGCQSPGTGTISPSRRLTVVIDGFVGYRLCSSSTVTGTMEKQSDDPTLRRNDPSLLGLRFGFDR
jgi:hypothetical protein